MRGFGMSGRKYLDFSSQLVNVNIGHQHPKLIAAIKEYADRLCTISPIHANEARSEAARLICELAHGDLNMVFFTNGGAEATENAMRMARVHTLAASKCSPRIAVITVELQRQFK